MACSLQMSTKSVNITTKDVKCSVKSVTYSKTFVKLMVKNSLLNILYRRLDLPKEEFVEKTFGKCPYVTFKSKSRHPVIMLFHTWQAAFVDALNKGYLRELYLFLQDPETQEVVENYKFRFRYAKEHLYKAIDQSVIIGTTEEFLTAVASLDEHPKLPQNTSLNIELSYNYDAPHDYNPPGFEVILKPMALSVPELSHPVVLGNLRTGFHRLSCEARGKFLISRSATPSVVTQVQFTALDNVHSEPAEEMFTAEHDTSFSRTSFDDKTLSGIVSTEDNIKSANNELTATCDDGKENNFNVANSIRTSDAEGVCVYSKPTSSHSSVDNAVNLDVGHFRFGRLSKAAHLSEETPSVGFMDKSGKIKNNSNRSNKTQEDDDDDTPSVFTVIEEDAITVSSEDGGDIDEVKKCVCRVFSQDHFATVTCCKCNVHYHSVCVGYLDDFPVESAFVCSNCDFNNCSDQKYVELQKKIKNKSDYFYMSLAQLRLALYLINKNLKLPVEFLKSLPTKQQETLIDKLTDTKIIDANSNLKKDGGKKELNEAVKSFFNNNHFVKEQLSSEDSDFEDTPVKRTRKL